MQDKTEDQAEVLPFFEDVLAETITRRNDWLIGNQALADFLERDTSTVTTLLTRKSLPARKVRIYGARKSEAGTWIVRVEDATHYKETHNKLLRTTNSKNGNNGAAGVEVITLKEGSPLLSQRDAEAIIKALWDVKLAIQGQTKALDENTKAVRDLRETWK